MTKFLLASASPRRAELLRKILSQFEIRSANVDEVLDVSKLAVINTERLATEKARAVFEKDSITLGVDTLGEINLRDISRVFGKPKDKAEARATLTWLSGQTHTVVSGFCVKTNKKEIIGHEETRVTFRQLSVEEIENYVQKNPVTSFAGSYAIQGDAKKFVEKIEGELENVIGLPLRKLSQILRSTYF